MQICLQESVMRNTAKHDTVDVPSSKMKLAIADILVNEGYIEKYDIIEDGAVQDHPHHFKVRKGQEREDYHRNQENFQAGSCVCTQTARICSKVLAGLGIRYRFHQPRA